MSSVVLSPILSAIIAVVSLLVGQNYTVQHNASQNNIQIKNPQGQVVATIPLQLASFRFFKTGLARVSYNKNAKTVGSPQIQFTNPYKDRKVTVTNISLVPDANFKTHGIVEVDVNGRSILDPTLVGSFTDLIDFNIPLPEGGIILDEGLTIDVFIWNDDNVTAVNLTASFAVGVY